MRVIYVGSKNMGVEALNLLAGFHAQRLIELRAVVVRADDDRTFWYRSVSKRARELGFKVFLPQKLNESKFISEMASLEADAGFCCFYPKLFPEEFFRLPKLGFYNLHFAPLPRYRGALPIPYAILAGEMEHGVTIHRIETGADTGPILSQVFFPIYSDDTGYELYSRCEKYGINLLQQTMNMFLQMGGNCALRQQDHTLAISHKRSDLASMEVSFSWGRSKVVRFVRAFDFPPFPLPFVMQEGKKWWLSVAPERHGFKETGVRVVDDFGGQLFLIDCDENSIC